MKNPFLLFSLFLIMICFGCTKSSFQDKPYDLEQAVKNGDVVVQLGVQNFERFKEFLHNLKDGKPDKVRITSYTIEGDPVFTDLEYDGKYIQFVYDNSHDEYGAQEEIIKDQCTKIDHKVNGKSEIEYSVSACLNKLEESYPLFSIEKRE